MNQPNPTQPNASPTKNRTKRNETHFSTFTIDGHRPKNSTRKEKEKTHAFHTRTQKKRGGAHAQANAVGTYPAKEHEPQQADNFTSPHTSPFPLERNTCNKHATQRSCNSHIADKSINTYNTPVPLHPPVQNSSSHTASTTLFAKYHATQEQFTARTTNSLSLPIWY